MGTTPGDLYSHRPVRHEESPAKAREARSIAADLRREADRLEHLAALIEGGLCGCKCPLSVTILRAERVGGEIVGWKLVDATDSVSRYVEGPIEGKWLWEVCDPPTASQLERLYQDALEVGIASEVLELGLPQYRTLRRVVTTAMDDSTVRATTHSVCDVCTPGSS
jgi:hypothetical protein